MEFLYTTDLHGNQNKYKTILDYAIDKKISLIHLGADILPTGKNLPDIQQTFIRSFLRNFYQNAKDNGITILTSFGNDDLVSMKKEFRKIGSLLDEEPVEIEGFLFKAYPWVCDHPFSLKSMCKLDYRGWTRNSQHVNSTRKRSKKFDINEYLIEKILSAGIDYSDEGKRSEIFDVDKYLASKTTIQEDFEREIVTHKNLIMSCHMPPKDLELDVCGRRTAKGYDLLERVGSASIYNWIKKQQPFLTLHGHIHENYAITNQWKVTLGKTLVVQPGQHFSNIYDKEEKTRFVKFELEPEHIISASLVEI